MKNTSAVPLAQVADLAAAIREALDLPQPADYEGIALRDRVAGSRAAYLRGALQHLAEPACDRHDGGHLAGCVANAAASARSAAEVCPVNYQAEAQS